MRRKEMRVFKNKYYILREHPGISGFQQWDKYEYRVVTGYKAANNWLRIVKEFKENGRGRFRLEDGHLALEKEIIPWLDKERYQTAFILNPEVYGLFVDV